MKHSISDVLGIKPRVSKQNSADDEESGESTPDSETDEGDGGVSGVNLEEAVAPASLVISHGGHEIHLHDNDGVPSIEIRRPADAPDSVARQNITSAARVVGGVSQLASGRVKYRREF